MDLLLVGKIVYLIFLWTFIILSLVFVKYSRDIYLQLRAFDKTIKDFRREYIHSIAPSVKSIEDSNQIANWILSLQVNSFNDFLLSSRSVGSEVLNSLSVFKKIMVLSFIVQKILSFSKPTSKAAL